jgi:hypothetical protein
MLELVRGGWPRWLLRAMCRWGPRSTAAALAAAAATLLAAAGPAAHSSAHCRLPAGPSSLVFVAMAKGLDLVYGLGVIAGALMRTGRTRWLGTGGGLLLLLPTSTKLKSLISLIIAVATGRQWGATLDMMPSGLASLLSALMSVLYARSKPRIKPRGMAVAKRNEALNYKSNLTDTEVQKGWGYSDVHFVQSGHEIKLVGSNHYPDIGGKVRVSPLLSSYHPTTRSCMGPGPSLGARCVQRARY